ncbi:MAG: hypothetical protein ACRCXZ_01865, partial [Patescibacteria group bacterium]
MILEFIRKCFVVNSDMRNEFGYSPNFFVGPNEFDFHDWVTYKEQIQKPIELFKKKRTFARRVNDTILIGFRNGKFTSQEDVSVALLLHAQWHLSNGVVLNLNQF